MARVARSTRTTKPAVKSKSARPSSPVAKAKPPKVTKAPAVAGRASASLVLAPKPSKDELRARVEQLERANTSLRGKSREATRSAKITAERIAELEAQVVQLEKQIARQAAPSKAGQQTVSVRGRRKPQRREIEPVDAVQLDVAVTESASADPETEVARNNLEADPGMDRSEAGSSDADEASPVGMPHPEEEAPAH